MHVGGSLQLDQSYVPNIELVHNHHIMDLFMQSGQYTPTEIIQLNLCQLYLQAITLSDITITITKGDIQAAALLPGTSSPRTNCPQVRMVTSLVKQKREGDNIAFGILLKLFSSHNAILTRTHKFASGYPNIIGHGASCSLVTFY
jgi:hypothetical protein